jgi:hypothetical protein
MTTTCIVITCGGPAVSLVDGLLLAKPTRRYPPGSVGHIIDEIRIATAQDRVRR